MGPLGDPARRHVVESLLRQALYNLTERGQHVELVVSDLIEGLDCGEGRAAVGA